MIRRFFDILIPSSSGTRFLALIMVIVAVFLACEFPAHLQDQISTNGGGGDPPVYLHLANDLRHGLYSHTMNTCFPPGYPLILALMPAPINYTSAILLSALLALASIPLVYLLVKKHVGSSAALLSSACWTFVVLISHDYFLRPMTEPLFIVACLVLFLVQKPIAKGFLSGFLPLIRPEGILLIFAGALGTKPWRSRFAVLVIALALNLPYLCFVHDISGRWQWSAKNSFNQQVSPYVIAGTWVATQKLEKMQGLPMPLTAYPHRPLPTFPPPTDPRVIQTLGMDLARKAQLYESPISRIFVNLRRCWERSDHPIFLAFLGFLGLIPLARKRNPLLLPIFSLIPLGLLWLPYFFGRERFMLLLLLSAALSAAGILFAYQLWPMHHIGEIQRRRRTGFINSDSAVIIAQPTHHKARQVVDA